MTVEIRELVIKTEIKSKDESDVSLKPEEFRALKMELMKQWEFLIKQQARRNNSYNR